MILIISDVDDLSTNDVLEWLQFKEIAVKRINGKDSIQSIAFNNNLQQNICLLFADDYVNFNDVKAYWYRRGTLNFQSKHNLQKYPSTLVRALNSELNKLTLYLHHILAEKPGLGNYINNSINKLKVLYNAQKLGLDVPKSIITSTKQELLEFYNKNGILITKAIQDISLLTNIEDKTFIPYTEVVDKTFIDQLPDEFFPSIFQEKLDKEYEIRVFYLDGVCYSMAIFSQSDSQTNVDFRRYNFEKPNRTVPYRLSKKLIFQFKQLMNKLELDTGSIDMVVTKDKRFVFLEVNPVGQFGMVSIPCNYYLEREIANNLIQKSEMNG